METMMLEGWLIPCFLASPIALSTSWLTGASPSFFTAINGRCSSAKTEIVPIKIYYSFLQYHLVDIHFSDLPLFFIICTIFLLFYSINKFSFSDTLSLHRRNTSFLNFSVVTNCWSSSMVLHAITKIVLSFTSPSNSSNIMFTAREYKGGVISILIIKTPIF